jgi:hypothetical protein
LVRITVFPGLTFSVLGMTSGTTPGTTPIIKHPERMDGYKRQIFNQNLDVDLEWMFY